MTFNPHDEIGVEEVYDDMAREELDRFHYEQDRARDAFDDFDPDGDDDGYAEIEDFDDEPWDGFRDDVDADADALRSAGWGTDEDYGGDSYDSYGEW